MNCLFSKKRNLGPDNLFLNDYNYDAWYEELDNKTPKK